jgi:hypothetical protein
MNQCTRFRKLSYAAGKMEYKEYIFRTGAVAYGKIKE